MNILCVLNLVFDTIAFFKHGENFPYKNLTAFSSFLLVYIMLIGPPVTDKLGNLWIYLDFMINKRNYHIEQLVFYFY